MSGKGDKPRRMDLTKFGDNFDQIDWSKKPEVKKEIDEPEKPDESRDTND